MFLWHIFVNFVGYTIFAAMSTTTIYRVGQKNWTILRVYNFATVGARNACDMSKFNKFYLEKNIKLACQCV